MLSDTQIDDFKFALYGSKGELDAWLEVNNEDDCRMAIKSFLAKEIEARELRIRELEQQLMTEAEKRAAFEADC